MFWEQYGGAFPLELTVGGLLAPANEVCKGYVFTGVYLSTRGSGCGRHPPRQAYPPGQAHLPGRHPTRQVPPGQVHPLGRYPRAGTPPLPGQTHPHSRAGTPPLADGQQAGGTHPTGMHSCLICRPISRQLCVHSVHGSHINRNCTLKFLQLRQKS